MLLYLATCDKAWRCRTYAEVLTSGVVNRIYRIQERNDPVQGRQLCAWCRNHDPGVDDEARLVCFVRRHKSFVKAPRTKMSAFVRRASVAV